MPPISFSWKFIDLGGTRRPVSEVQSEPVGPGVQPGAAGAPQWPVAADGVGLTGRAWPWLLPPGEA